MRRPLLFVVLAIVAGLAAVLAIGVPTAGPDLPELTPAPEAPAAAEVAPEGSPPVVASADPGAEDEAPDAGEASPELVAHEEAARSLSERRSRPDARKSAAFASAWNGIQYRLSSRKEPGAAELATEIAALVRDFRDAYHKPEGADLGSLYTRSSALRARLQASGLVDDALRAQITRLETLATAPAAPTGPVAGPEVTRPAGDPPSSLE